MHGDHTEALYVRPRAAHPLAITPSTGLCAIVRGLVVFTTVTVQISHGHGFSLFSQGWTGRDNNNLMEFMAIGWDPA